MVDFAAPINARQVEVLRWIADGCPEGVMEGFTFKTTAVALQARRLVVVSRKGGVWRAEVTEAGRYYVRHGTYPEGLWRGRPSRPALARAQGRPRGEPQQPAKAVEPAISPVLGPPAPTPGELAQSMVARVAAAGGAVEVAGRLGGYDDVLAAARTAPNLPPGKRLRCRSAGSWSSPVLEMYFDEDFSVQVTERPVPVPARVTAYHRAAAAYRDDADRHEVSKASLGRACRILHALAIETERRGHLAAAAPRRDNQYNSGFVSSLKDGHLQITIDEFSYRIRIREQGAPGGGPLPYYYGTRGSRLPRWRAVKKAEFVPTGKLRITIDEGYSRDRRPAEFRDSTRLGLEDRLPAVLRELEIRALEGDWRRREQHRKAEDKRRRWEAAMDRARHDHREAFRATVLTGQLQQRRLVRELDEYLADMRVAIAAISGEQARAAAARWLAWVSEHRHNIDPLRQIVMPADPGPTAADLKPFLRGWSPYSPDSHA